MDEINLIIEPQGWKVSRRGLFLLKQTIMDKGIRYSFEKKEELLKFLIDDRRLVGLDELMIRELRVRE